MVLFCVAHRYGTLEKSVTEFNNRIQFEIIFIIKTVFFSAIVQLLARVCRHKHYVMYPMAGIRLLLQKQIVNFKLLMQKRKQATE